MKTTVLVFLALLVSAVAIGSEPAQRAEEQADCGVTQEQLDALGGYEITVEEYCEL